MPRKPAQQAEPITQKYQEKCEAALQYAARFDAGKMGGVLAWNDRYLAGLFRNGLMLTQHMAYTMMHDPRYPGGTPMVAPRPTDDEYYLWPEDTWIIFQD